MEFIDRVLLQVLTAPVVLHQGSDVLVPAHHLHLTDAITQVQRSGDRCPPQIMRRDVPDLCEVSIPSHQPADHPRRERLVVDQSAWIGVRLKEVSVRTIRARDPSP